MQGQEDDQEPGSRRSAVVGLIVVVALSIAAYYLFTALRQNGELQDCLMSGRKNCAPIDIPAPSR